MSPKKIILKTLAAHQAEDGGGKPIRPATIPGFSSEPEKYQRTINALLKDRLIEGAKDQEGHLAISLNAHRAREIRRELRPLWARPAFLALLTLFAAAAGMTLLG